eukprot:m.52554 g.52554  ORF g.52554 m.52554 type:complete len:81 (-) comp21627_c0_seq1:37-279(-)
MLNCECGDVIHRDSVLSAVDDVCLDVVLKTLWRCDSSFAAIFYFYFYFFLLLFSLARDFAATIIQVDIGFTVPNLISHFE